METLTLTIPVGERDHIEGNPQAPVTMLEYGDFECPYCGQAYALVKSLQDEFSDTLCFGFRHFPLTQVHPHAFHAALAAEAAGKQDKFWEMHDTLFEHQNALENEDLLEYAETLHLDTTRFVIDMASEDVADKVRADFMSGIRSGVNGTPTFFINGTRHDHWYDYDLLRAAIVRAAEEAT